MKRKDRVIWTIRQLSPVFWGLSIGVICLYGFGLVMGAFRPWELMNWTILVLVLGVLVAFHVRRIHQALEAHDPEMMRALAQARERRGF